MLADCTVFANWGDWTGDRIKQVLRFVYPLIDKEVRSPSGNRSSNPEVGAISLGGHAGEVTHIGIWVPLTVIVDDDPPHQGC
jgi:hypothetical protein